MRLLAGVLIAVLLGGSNSAWAGFRCGEGLIDMLLLPSTGQSNLRLHLTSAVKPMDLWRYHIDQSLPPMVSIWESDSPTRWNKKVDALQLAFAMQLPVRVTSNDYNCMGPQDEFEIRICSAGKDCSPPAP
ncbi:hypothetical protein [Roseateles amylovorans]|uniref:Toxin co-regulated pilus biosynthesis protein Q C-terminal domain-containing protein n=1 Tax=Roseateles amylovorans TaxID=2978473 RepID=A0ABY6B0S8_9BURK|nr:hypothetical protein [Roseateles amylovorans]UXH78787.1 hypothetical protein N4261_02275 [Roseateles amylovorans]